MNQLYFLFVQVSKGCFRKMCVCFTSNSGSLPAEMNQGESAQCGLAFFCEENRREPAIPCLCSEFCTDANWGCFLECTGSNYGQMCLCGIHIPSHFPNTHPCFQPSISGGLISFFPRITTQENNGLSSGTSKQSKQCLWTQGLVSFCFTAEWRAFFLGWALENPYS